MLTWTIGFSNFIPHVFASDGSYTFLTQWGSFGTGDGQFERSGPSGITIASSGNVYVVDPTNFRIEEFTTTGTFITKWGSFGTGDGQFESNTLGSMGGITIASSGSVYVVDGSHSRIQKFDSSGNFITKWGSSGTGNGQFDNPSGITIANSGNVYVADFGNNRIQKFDSSGTFITKWGVSSSSNFSTPSLRKSIAVDSSENIYVTVSGSYAALYGTNYAIQKFDSSGNFITQWTLGGCVELCYITPGRDFYIGIDGNNNVYVSTVRGLLIVKFNSSGTFLNAWGIHGTGNGETNVPLGIAINSSGNVYLTDSSNQRILVFQSPNYDDVPTGLFDLNDLISDSRPGVLANHTIAYTTLSGLTAGQTIIITFPSGFVIPSALDFNDIDLVSNGINQTLGTTASGSTWGVAIDTTARTITFTSGTGTISAGGIVQILIGTNATSGATGAYQITNPSSIGSYTITAGGTQTGNGETQVVITNAVTVSGTVSSTLSFTVSSVAGSVAINGITTTAASTATTIPFGKLGTTSSTIGQNFAVSTNAKNGFTVYARTTTTFNSPGTGATIQYFKDAAATATPTAWTAPLATPSNSNTYGHWGLTTNDTDLTTDTGAAGDNFGNGTSLYAGNLNATVPGRAVFAAVTPSDGTASGTARVAYSVQLSALQPAANDYAATIVYSIAPRF